MNLNFTVTGTGKAAEKASLLLSKTSAGAKIRKTEWPTWQRTSEGKYWLKKGWSKDNDIWPDSGRRMVFRYAQAMGVDEDDLDPRAVNWEAFAAWCAHDPKDGACDVCGRGSAHGAVCEDCGRWSADVADEWSKTRAA